MQKIEITIARSIQDVLEAIDIRLTVFVQEQHVPLERERDEHDSGAHHVLVRVDGKSVGTIRFRWIGPDKVKLERLAILKPYRRMGLGRELLQFVERYARLHKVKELTLGGQLQAAEFYRKQGYRMTGRVFLDAGIRHKKFVKRLV